MWKSGYADSLIYNAEARGNGDIRIVLDLSAFGALNGFVSAGY